jgi:ApaG protein
MHFFFPFAEETRGIIVRVAPNYMAEQSDPKQGRWFWAYHIRIENKSDMAVQLITRHWEITDARGAMQIVDGEGVIGEQPVLQPGGAYDYVSGCPLATPSGMMEGSFQMLAADGSHFDANVPRFELRAPVSA